MYRVELKEGPNPYQTDGALYVPNVPCGVERSLLKCIYKQAHLVPNVPCGVERRPSFGKAIALTLFLMYRVELKGYLVMGRA